MIDETIRFKLQGGSPEEMKEVMKQVYAALKEKGDGLVFAMWCGDEECEDKIKEETGVGSRCIPFEQENLSDVCVCCGKPAKYMVYWGKAY